MKTQRSPKPPFLHTLFQCITNPRHISAFAKPQATEETSASCMDQAYMCIQSTGVALPCTQAPILLAEIIA